MNRQNGLIEIVHVASSSAIVILLTYRMAFMPLVPSHNAPLELIPMVSSPRECCRDLRWQSVVSEEHLEHCSVGHAPGHPIWFTEAHAGVVAGDEAI